MKVITKQQMINLMENYPNGGIVFFEGDNQYIDNSVMVTDGDFEATNILPTDGEEFDWDWNIEESRENDVFTILDKDDILFIIQQLTKGIKVDLKLDYYY